MSYPGGKNGSGVYQTLINLMPPHDVYIEPFLGGGAVMRMKRPARMNIGIDLVEASELPIQDCIAAMGESAGSIARSGEASSRSTSTGNGAGGSARRNARGQLEAGPLAETRDWRSPSPPAESGEPSSFRFIQGSGIEWLEAAPPDCFRSDRRTLVYCDPPYLMETRSGRRLYAHEMTVLEHRRLLRCLQDLPPCMVIISGYSHPLYAQMLKVWNAASYQTTTRGGKPVAEWVWYNFPRPVELHDYRFLGENFRERERIKRKKTRWTNRLARMPLLERQALLSAIAESAGFGDTGPARQI